MSRNLKDDIISHLKKKGNYESEVDDYLIDILIQNVAYAELMKQDLYEKGLIVTIPNGNGIATTKENPAFSTYIKCLDNIHQSASKLGLNRKDRIQLKLMEEKLKDEFDKDF